MRHALPAVVFCLVVLPAEAVLLPHLGLGAARADLALCALLWLAVGPASTLEGAVGAYLCGTIADILYAVHPGLFALLGVLFFVVARIGSSVRLGAPARGQRPRQVRPRSIGRGAGGFALLCGLFALVQPLLAAALLAVVGQRGPEFAWAPSVGGALLTAVCAPAIYLLLGFAASGLERNDASLLR